MSLRKALSFLAALLMLASAGAAWSQAGPPYSLLTPPQATDGSGKIEVVEFFWYGCPHCYALEPAVNAWLKTAPKDVVFKRIPAFPNDVWGQGAAMYYTLEAMGILDQYHQKVFDAIHRDKVNFANKSNRDAWLKTNGIDPVKYAEVEKSFAVISKLARARQLTQSYKVDSVPRIIVNGKYVTSGEQAGGADKIFSTVDQLVAMSRKEKG
jgi:protein dithiol oxidoreductase (disulfide-forming)